MYSVYIYIILYSINLYMKLICYKLLRENLDFPPEDIILYPWSRLEPLEPPEPTVPPPQPAPPRGLTPATQAFALGAHLYLLI